MKTWEHSLERSWPAEIGGIKYPWINFYEGDLDEILKFLNVHTAAEMMADTSQSLYAEMEK